MTEEVNGGEQPQNRNIAQVLSRMLWAIEIARSEKAGTEIEDKPALWEQEKSRYTDTARRLINRLEKQGYEIREADVK